MTDCFYIRTYFICYKQVLKTCLFPCDNNNKNLETCIETDMSVHSVLVINYV